MESQESGKLFHNLILFGRLLRALGMDVNPGRMIDLAIALDYVEIGRKADFYYTIRSLLVHDQDDLELFDQAFNLFWKKPKGDVIDLGLLVQLRPEGLVKENKPIVATPSLGEDEEVDEDEGLDDEELQEVIEVTQTYSAKEVLRQKDFGELSQDEMTAIKLVMSQMVWQLGMRKTRRRKMGDGRSYDLRRILRKNLRYGGEIIEWPRRKIKYKPRPLIILADISGSMERYTRLLLHFIYSLAEGLDQQVEAFVFSTHLTRITRQLRGKDIDYALQEVGQMVNDWSGGTRIGEAIKTFNYDWGRRVLGRGAVVLLISDGWDRGDPELLGTEMARLQRSAHRTVWLNPLLGSERYEPLTRGIQAALPYIDDFLPVHNLASLEDLAAHLKQLTEEKRPSRHKKLQLSGASFIKQR